MSGTEKKRARKEGSIEPSSKKTMVADPAPKTDSEQPSVVARPASAGGEKLQALFGRSNQPEAPRKLKGQGKGGQNPNGATIRMFVWGVEEKTMPKTGTPPKIMLSGSTVMANVSSAYGGVMCGAKAPMLLATERLTLPQHTEPVRQLVPSVEDVDGRSADFLQVMFDKVDANKAPSEATKCRVGHLVELDRVWANVGNGKNGKAVYVNAAPSLKIIGADVPAHKVLMTDEIQLRTAINLIASLGGPESFTGDDNNLQKGAYLTHIRSSKNHAVAELQRIAKTVSEEERTGAINPLLQRINDTCIEDLASGKAELFQMSPYDEPYGVFVQDGLSVTETVPALARMLNDPSRHEQLPTCFTASWVMEAKPSGGLGRFDIDMRTVTVFNKHDIDVNDPFSSAFVSPNSSVSFAVTMNRAAVSIGVTTTEKTVLFYPLIMRVANFTVVAKLPRQTSEWDRIASFCPGDGPIIDMQDAVKKLGYPVDKDFLVQYLCGGAQQYIPKIKGTKQEMPSNTRELPTIESHGWQNLDSDAFGFEDLETEQEAKHPGVALTYFVIDRNALEEPDACVSTFDESRKALVAKATAAQVKMGAYLKENTAVYALSQ